MPQRSAYRWVCLGLLFFSGLLAFFVRLAPAVAIPDLQRAFSLDAVELGLLTALYLWPFALMQPIAGVLVDAFGARRTVTIFLVIAGTGQVVFALAPSFSVALLGRALSGLGAATLYVGAAQIMTRWFRSSEFGTLTGAWTSVANLGGLTAAGPLAASIALVGWRISLGTVGVTVLVTALLVHIFVRDTPGELKLPASAEIDSGRRAEPTPSVWQGMLIVLQTPNTWLLGGYAVLLFGTMTMMQGLWAVGLIAGCTLWGFVAETIVPSRKAVVLMGAVVYGVLWAVLAIWPSGLPVGVRWLAMFWGGFFASTWIPSYAQLKDSVPPGVVATAMGMLNLFFWAGGAVYQQISGLILARFPLVEGHIPVAAYQTLFWFSLASVGLSVVLVAFSGERRKTASLR
jgi:MFS family permease